MFFIVEEMQSSFLFIILYNAIKLQKGIHVCKIPCPEPLALH